MSEWHSDGAAFAGGGAVGAALGTWLTAVATHPADPAHIALGATSVVALAAVAFGLDRYAATIGGETR